MPPPDPSPSSILCEGWVLKKRRKKMQGFARRYFFLYPSGLLAYAFEPGQPIRDQIYLHHAAISTAPGRKDIHIDCNTATFHIKCLSTQDFNTWMSAFRKSMATGVEARRSPTIKHPSRHGSVSFSKSSVIIEEMAAAIAELEESFLALSQEFPTKKHASIGKKGDKEKSKDHSRFNLFKKPPHSHSGQQTDDIDVDPTLASSSLSHMKASIDTLKLRYSVLVDSVQAALANNPVQSAHSLNLPYTAEEDEEDNGRRQDSISVNRFGRRADRMSIATTISDNEWFDAVDDGPEEFFMNLQDTPEQEGRPGLIVSDDSRSSLEPPETSSVDTEVDQKSESPTRIKEGIAKTETEHQIVRRTQLPVLPTTDEGNLFSVFKKNVGKDLSTISFPVTFNEPLTLLQRAAEEVEYHRLLDQAAQSDDPVKRLSFVAAFAVSGYAHTRHRSGRKGFNPMLAETFEDVRMKFIAEKVSHHPVEIAYHAEGENWELLATSCGKTKFWGKSLEFIPTGTTRLRIGNDHYVWKKPSSFIRNLVVGTKYFEHSGQMVVENTTSDLRCILDFKQNGYWGPSNVIAGSIITSKGETLSTLEGKWDDQISQTLDSSHFHVLWRISPFPKTVLDYYGFTSFGITLNELSNDLIDKLPPTDSRYRPDVRALENGDIDFAESEKVRVEELQRGRRNRGEDVQPRWFRRVDNEWEYVGGYWETRLEGWEGTDIRPLW